MDRIKLRKIMENAQKVSDIILDKLKEDLSELEKASYESKKEIIEEHRNESRITCPEQCWCWEAEKQVLQYDLDHNL